MYHRFGESKYPSTNIGIEEFKKHLEMIEKEGIKFIDPKNFEAELKNVKERKILITIDDGFASFYENAWPILREKQIPFILFVSTREVGKFNYMSWSQIKEIDESKIGLIGNHSHTHEYLIDLTPLEIKQDLVQSMDIFKTKLGSNSIFFSYPFGEYSLKFKKIVKDLNFKYAFGQHSGVIDSSKDLYELPRFPINEKYGKLDRFSTLLKTLPFKYEYIEPREKYIFDNQNPPKVEVKFFDHYKNLNLINCFSNEENVWRNSKITFKENNLIAINLDGKFVTERGRINCSLKSGNYFRWLGMQFVIAEK